MVICLPVFSTRGLTTNPSDSLTTKCWGIFDPKMRFLEQLGRPRYPSDPHTKLRRAVSWRRNDTKTQVGRAWGFWVDVWQDSWLMINNPWSVWNWNLDCKTYIVSIPIKFIKFPYCNVFSKLVWGYWWRQVNLRMGLQIATISKKLEPLPT